MGSKVALTNEQVAPHSFLNFIFISEKDFKQGVIEEEILNHELAHVKQLHSMDILLIEIITIFAWINPLLALYKRAVQLNHEFLADEHVTGALKEIHPYQMLLLSRLNQPKRMYFASPFNYLDIKKRIIMMNRKVSYKHAILKQIALIPIFGVMTLVFASKTVAQEPISVVGITPSTQQGASQDLVKLYQSILDKYIYTLPDGKRGQRLNISKEDKDKLEKIFFQMSKEQQESQVIAFVPKNTLLLKVKVPTQDQIESFKEPKTYGVWIDGKRVNNEELEKFKNADFSFVSVSKLQSNALNYGKHVYQVDLMTNTAYQDYYSKAIAQEGYILMPSAKRVRNKTP
jgi:hypothetical protein